MSDHRITLVFEDGISIVVAANEVETIYQAAARQDVPIQTDCREGACATCRATCVAGRYELSDYSDEALPPEEEAAGGVLACQMRARSDCVIEFPYPSSAITVRKADPTPAVVEGAEEVARDVFRLVLRLRAEKGRAFLPGQYVNIAVPGSGAVRSYSFANAPQSDDLAEFYVRRLPAGVMSDWLSGGQALGAETVVSAPMGQFFLRRADAPMLMVAGGTGLAPMLSMLRHLAGQPDLKPPRITLLYGTNVPGEMFAADELADLDGKLPLDVRRAAVTTSNGFAGTTGFVTDLMRPDMLDALTDCYLCGPPAMVTAARAFLTGQGIDQKRIFAERFLAAAS
jgi:benzoate/toluate 1,2-dioxygenase reductase subunit